MGSDIGPMVGMIALQVCYAGLNIISKLAMQSGMNPLILITYRQILGTLTLAPFAFLMEIRKTRAKMTISVLFQIFLCSLSGATGNQILFFFGLKYTTSTISSAMTNILPAATFVLALLFRQESASMKSKDGLAKVIGTIVCVSGAMVLSLYQGEAIEFLGESKLQWSYAVRLRQTNPNQYGHGGNRVIGSILLLLSSFAWALWFVIQARLSKRFKAPYTSSTLLCLMASIECGLIAVISERKIAIAAWSLKSTIRLVGALYSGIVCSGFTFGIASWIIQKKGPLYVSIFNPLLLIIVAILSWTLLGEKLYSGTVFGSVLIVAGLYTVLWGKSKEMKVLEPTPTLTPNQTNIHDRNEDIELQK